MVKALLRHGADPSVLDGEGKDAMAGAIAKGSAEALRALLEAGAQPNRRWADGHCAVTRAALHGQVELLKLVLDHKGDPDFRDDQGITPLMFAVAMGHEAAARLLLERGAKVHPLNAWQHSALEEAKAVKDEALRVRLVALLRQHGAKEGNPMRPIDEAFLKAAHEGDLTQLKALLDKGADVHARGKLTADLWIRDALSGSVKHMAVCRFLLERKINVRMKDGYEFTALHAAAREGSPAMVKLLVEQGLDPNAKSKSGFVPLFMAINGGHRPDNAAMLLQLGADPNGRAITGDSLLAYARKRNHTKMAQLLEAAGGKE
jgi:ankyrin repeat protein